MPTAIVFDDGKGSLALLTDTRPSFGVRTGALTTLERLALIVKAEAKTEVTGVWTPEPLAALAREQITVPVNDESRLSSAKQAVLLVNGRCPVLPEGVGELKVGAAMVTPSGDVIAARLPAADALGFLRSGALPASCKASPAGEPCLLEHPWDVIRFRDAALDIDLRAFFTRESQGLPPGVIGISDDQIHVSPEALVYPGVVFDAEHGPIVIDDGAVIRPGAVIIGPAYIGRGSTVIDRALIKGHTAIGPVCKVAGEVGGCIFQGFANKAHDGHLGDSWVGEWANLGAGTTNSNLLNTYGEVIAQSAPDGKRCRTGLRFLGCIIGDHVKMAILTRIMTGSVFGTGSMIAAMNPPSAVGRFEWVTDEPGAAGGVKRQPYRIEKFLDVARAAMARRKVTLSPSLEQRLRALAAAPGS